MSKSCPASMVNFIWFTDDKLLKIYHCGYKNAQYDNFHTLVYLYTFQQDSAPAHTACEIVEFMDCATPDFMAPCCLELIK